MTLQEKINEDLKQALKSKLEPTLGTLRLVKADIQYELTKTGGSSLDDLAVVQILKANYKKRMETASEYEKVGRLDLAEKETKEAEVIQVYIPQEISEDEIKTVVTSVIKEISPSGPSDMGKVMGKTMAVFKGKNIDGNKVSTIVKNALASL